MRPFDDFIDECPKCGQYMGTTAEIRWHEANVSYGDGFVGSYDHITPEHLSVMCRRCDWSYEMRTKDAEAVPA